eukprot:COSAG05_NODE_511_length_9092_cov_6.078839_6_plen_107_part_00
MTLTLCCACFCSAFYRSSGRLWQPLLNAARAGAATTTQCLLELGASEDVEVALAEVKARLKDPKQGSNGGAEHEKRLRHTVKLLKEAAPPEEEDEEVAELLDDKDL